MDVTTFAGTQLLTIEQPLDEVMVAGISRFALRALAESPRVRDAKWKRDYSSAEAYTRSVEPNRRRFRTIIGAVDEREKARGFELVARLGEDGVIARSNHFTVYSVRWPVVDGVTGEGLLLEPRGTPVARVIALPDADGTPEMFVGITAGGKDKVTGILHVPSAEVADGDSARRNGKRSLPANLRRFAANGVQMLVPTLISRDDTYSGSPLVAYTNQPHREFIYRQAFELGRHMIGYEVEKVQAAVDQFALLNERENRKLPIGVAGVGEGSLVAFYAAATDPRIDAALVSGYFQPREKIWQEPIYRNTWRLLTEFGDAEIASLITPRRLVIEACAAPEIAGPPQPRDGRRGGAAPGKIVSPPFTDVKAEYERAKRYCERLGDGEQITLVSSGDGSGPSGSDAAFVAFAKTLQITNRFASTENLYSTSAQIDPDERQRRQVEELTGYTQRLMRLSPRARDEFWANADRSSTENWGKAANFYRDYVWEEMIGKLPEPVVPANVRTRLVFEEPAWKGYEVVIDVYQDVIAAGILLLPKNMKLDEKRPVVVCQHGLEGTPWDTITRSGEAYNYYKGFAADLVERGFIVYAPQSPYRGGDKFRVLQRQLNPLGISLFSVIIRQHQRTLKWLATLPNVDPRRIGFYGLSYGGKTAMRVPPILHDLYALSICSGDFNDWIRKVCSTDDKYSYVITPEYEMPEWNMGHIASYVELASLMTPRPFMVERGHDDGVAPDEWLASEFAKVQRHYDRLGLGDRAEIEFFNGPHTIHGVGTYAFLHKHLQWPQ